MLLFAALTGCFVFPVCRNPDDPPTCEVVVYDSEGMDAASTGQPMHPYFGLQGGNHLELEVLLAGTSEHPDVGVEVIAEDGTVVAEKGLWQERYPIEERDTCSGDALFLQAPFSGSDLLCGREDDVYRVVVTVVRRDGTAGTCETTGTVATDRLDVWCDTGGF
jgi:hypothetical protein